MLILNVDRKDNAEASSAPSTSHQKEKQVTMIDVEPEETSETSSMVSHEVASQQRAWDELDNSFISGEAVEDGSDAALDQDQEFIRGQKMFQKESVALQKAMLKALQELIGKISKEQ